MKELGILMKSWGLNPTKQEVQDIMKEIDDSGDGEFDFPEFIEIMSARMEVRIVIFSMIGVFYESKFDKILLASVSVESVTGCQPQGKFPLTHLYVTVL